MSHKQLIPIGIDDFLKLRTRHYSYVDKTFWLSEILNDDAEVVLLPRPRRFGKTLNLSTLRYFTEKSSEDRSALFSDLTVWKDTLTCQTHFQQHPVIFLTLKEIKPLSFDKAFRELRNLLSSLYEQHGYLLESSALHEREKSRFLRILHQQAEDVELEQSLKDLSEYLYKHYQKPALILIDEYDSPLHAAYIHGYYPQALEFFRPFLSSALKGNPFLLKGVITGILRVAKESIFSDLNNLSAHTLLSKKYATSFGFTESEVETLTRSQGLDSSFDEIKTWYNGYTFSGHKIYNPWSVLNYLQTPENGLRAYWAGTSSNDLIQQTLTHASASLYPELQALLQGKTIHHHLQENLPLQALTVHSHSIWSLLLFTGYLTAENLVVDETGLHADLRIPNFEVRQVFERAVVEWFQLRLGGETSKFLQAFLAGDAETTQSYLEQILLSSWSFHDHARGPLPSEAVYHAFILGILVSLRGEYEIWSNSESGFGRCDVLVLPRKTGNPGVAIEFKVAKNDQISVVEEAIRAGLEQIKNKKYRQKLMERGAHPIHEFVIVFHQKQVWVRKMDCVGFE